jgi:3-hydroxyisobutyrate dehydrogenase-like beta-hydroxyacid dehydrogenase
MTIKTIAILSPGDMGHGVGKALGENGFEVITCLTGRSDRTRALAEEGGIRDVPDLGDMAGEADLVLSILVPSQAAATARAFADAASTAGASAVYADCNAVSLRTAREIDTIITGAGSRFIDGGIIGGSPARGAAPRFYCCGPHSSLMIELDGKGIAVRDIGGEVGRASGIKMCYASFTKGTSALLVAMLTAAESLGLSDELASELAFSQPDTLKRAETSVTGLPSNAGRWIGEMEEIAATFDATGVTPHLHRGAAEMFRLLASTPFADESPETVDRSRTMADTIRVVAEHLPARTKIGD